jgi:hypothetical protein
MAQKTKKQVRKTPRSTNGAEIAVAEKVSPVVSSTVSAPGSSRSFTSEFNPDYSQTIKDLKRIAILASTFFAILIVLALIVP